MKKQNEKYVAMTLGLIFIFILVFAMFPYIAKPQTTGNGVGLDTTLNFKDGTHKTLKSSSYDLFQALFPQTVSSGGSELDSISEVLWTKVAYTGTMSSFSFSGKITVLVSTNIEAGKGVVLKTVTISKSGTSLPSGSEYDIVAFLVTASDLNNFFKNNNYASGNYYVKIQLNSLTLSTVIGGNSKTYKPSNAMPFILQPIKVTYSADPVPGVTQFTVYWKSSVVPWISPEAIMVM